MAQTIEAELAHLMTVDMRLNAPLDSHAETQRKVAEHMRRHDHAMAPGNLDIGEFDSKIDALKRVASDIASKAEALFLAGRV